MIHFSFVYAISQYLYKITVQVKYVTRYTSLHIRANRLIYMALIRSGLF